MNQEDVMVVNRFKDLALQADRKGFAMFSDFLTLNEISLLNEKKADYVSAFSLYGGYDLAERQIAAFYPQPFYMDPGEIQYPIECILLQAASQKYADVLNHRDVLGALMHQGIQRKKIGDILLKEWDIYIFCHQSISDVIVSDVSKIKHTIVRGTKIIPKELQITPEFEEKEGFVASNRLDVIVACLCNLSRSKSVEMILSERVFINGKMISNYNQSIHPGDIISLRGFGKVVFDGFLNTTKKGRLRIQYRIYK